MLSFLEIKIRQFPLDFVQVFLHDEDGFRTAPSLERMLAEKDIEHRDGGLTHPTLIGAHTPRPPPIVGERFIDIPHRGPVHGDQDPA
jgi:hypothetical protein